MKKLICLIFLAIVSFNLYSQEMQPVEYKPVKIDYLAKSKKQRKVGWILTGTGAAIMSVGLVVGMVEATEEGFGSLAYALAGQEQPETESKSISGPLLIGGTALLATGITFLTIAKHNKRKALSMSFINESSQQLRYNTVMNTSVPSVRLRLQF